MQINFHSLLWSYLPRVPMFLAMTMCVCVCVCVCYIYIYIHTHTYIHTYSISQKWVDPSHFCKHFIISLYSLLWPAVETLMAVCWVILRGQHIYTVTQAVHSLLYIVAKCHFFSVVTWKYIIQYLQKCEGCTHLRWALYISSHIAYCKIFCFYEKQLYENNM